MVAGGAKLFKNIDLVVGIIFLFAGIIGVFHFLNMSFPFIPSFIVSFVSMPFMLKIMLFIAAILHFLSCFHVKTPPMYATVDWSGVVFATILSIIGVFPMLLSYGIIGQFIPVNFEIPLIVLSGLLALFGVFLFMDFFKIRRYIIVMGYH